MHRHYLECWQVLFLLLLLTHTVCLRHLWGVRPYALSLVFSFTDSFVLVLLLKSTLNLVPSNLRVGQPNIYPFNKISAVWFGFDLFLVLLSWFLFIFFSYLHLFNGVRFQYSWVSISPSVQILSWIGIFISSIIRCFQLFIISMAHFSISNFIPIFTACISVSNSFSILANSLMSSMYIRWLIFFLRFTKFVSACAFPKFGVQSHHHNYKY